MNVARRIYFLSAHKHVYYIYVYGVVMRLNAQTDFALRLLSHLAAGRGGLVTIAQVANRFQISKNHLTKVAHMLVKHGVIKTARGRLGGLYLSRPAADIRLGDVVRLMENDFALVECMQEGDCLIAGACRIKRVLQSAMDAFFDVLDQYTLQDLVVRNRNLKMLLAPEAA